MNAIQALSQADMQKVNESILAQLNSDVVLINQLGFYIVQGGGKRIRPLIAVLAARALGFEGQKAITCATFVEFIHTASLLHDDVVDESDMRRGRATANAEFGNAASVLVGDFIYTRAFQLVAQLESLKILRMKGRTPTVRSVARERPAPMKKSVSVRHCRATRTMVEPTSAGIPR